MKKVNKKKPAHITQHAWDAIDNPTLTRQEIKAMRPAGDILPKVFMKAVEEGRVGRPASSTTKCMVSMRMDEDILHALRAKGKGWQTQLNLFLRKAMEEKLW